MERILQHGRHSGMHISAYLGGYGKKGPGSLSRETVTIVENFGLTDAQKADVDQIVTALQRYVDVQNNESVESRNFCRRIVGAFGDFLVSLRELAKTCKFCTEECLQKHIRDQIIEGLVDGDAIEDLERLGVRYGHHKVQSTVSCQEATGRNVW